MVKVKFFAALRERLQCAEMQIASQPDDSVAAVRARLIEQHPHWQRELLDNDVLCAKNFAFVGHQEPVRSGDELAFFPPVTGG
ncbi:MoaD/ThiS family protein [Pseudidiomarina terrestris]|uniref:Molybdopterin synthase sulfur carrier subunit n=1 Tax=Pseudidiomarina terrestris TaxID=2820060 RepID=A0AAW7QZ75_9GAMM|nr:MULTISPECIES: MoaD/ThiS family protein [unclassified Pseudidiomarina]MDN7124737.1 MoaD/ThiS family protein [Pseudidiomarina sp. 1APP75-32.1]MDN7125794.1 MoaD/ThiS family protein [Pseudidiomarina sp. 1APR75-33.1]MDN7129789.1 MoaD/ThiS family protein [Pseudidiomarina sp. 1APR75-15]MDN7136434.1 MoaD/ThiS family protein [Pseudidiomarina sp. 1ASP75-5]MDN7137954.1 MoaD/ThiS family protein [Pseudidiomarina sp. 1ASP75-14]